MPMHCLLEIVSKFNVLELMHACDWASTPFLPMAACKGCILAKIQPHTLSSLTTLPHKQNSYETALRDLHWHMPYMFKICELVIII